jgi:hypothetical protein
MQFVCDYLDDDDSLVECCGPLDYIIFHGYSFGDRLLEDVEWKAWIENGEVRVTTVSDWDSDRYLHKLNKELWHERALEHVKQLDIATCPKCRDDISAQPK